MKATYVWHKDQLVTFKRQLMAEDFTQASMHKYRYCPCVDVYEELPSMRYGHWAVDDTVRVWPATWESSSFEGFPAEFKAHLLLLGVS